MDFVQEIATIDNALRMAYVDEKPTSEHQGVIVLIHGFPQTAYQFRKVIGTFTTAGYRVVATDYRGAGLSSKPKSDFRKSTMANDIALLLNHLQIHEPVHIVGYDIGGMVAYAFATHHADQTASLVWGECPLPGTAIYEEELAVNGAQLFHFFFHLVPDLPEALVAGREEVYLGYFLDKTYNTSAILQKDLDYYTESYARPGAMRCAFDVYRAFPTDAAGNAEWIAKHGKCKVRTLGLNGEKSRRGAQVMRTMEQAHQEGTFQVAKVSESGHYLAEENPEGFAAAILVFIKAER